MNKFSPLHANCTLPAFFISYIHPYIYIYIYFYMRAIIWYSKAEIREDKANKKITTNSRQENYV